MSEPSEEIIGVAELDRRLKGAVEAATGREWVEGEVGSLKRAASGHVYFSLKDEREDALIDCVMYRMSAQRVRFELKDGARVQLWGKATLWAPRGRLQLVAERARPAGRGALLEALERLKARLAEEGLFDPARKRPLPVAPKLIGVVTTKVGAAFHDIRTVALRRGSVHLVLAPAQVQGEGAPESLLRALDLIERYPGLEVLIVGRGGGAAEDLAAFNDERVVRRLARTRVPVVSAVGHEIDYTLADLVADVRAATPSQAAELVVEDERARREQLQRLSGALARAMSARVAEDRVAVGQLRAKLIDPRFIIAERQQLLDELLGELERGWRRTLARRRGALEAHRGRLALQHPNQVVARARARLAPLLVRLDAALRRAQEGRARQLGVLGARLHALSPLQVLGRGYAIGMDEHGRALRRAQEVTVGQRLTLRLAEGRLEARVTGVKLE